MTEFVLASIIIALVTCWIVLFMRKIGVTEWVQVHAKQKIISELFSCGFCLCWWISLIISLFFALYLKDALFLLCPFCATPVARFMYVG